jgi:signal transduction histidine kinase
VFASVGRRLALLNAAVVLLVIAVVGVGTALLLRESLEREANDTLKEQTEAAAKRWSAVFAGPTASVQPSLTGQSLSPKDTDDDDAKDVFKRGDTLLYAIGLDGSILVNERELSIQGLPVSAGVTAAQHGKSDTRITQIDGEPVRVYTEPVETHDQIVGFVQAVRGEREHQQELRLVQLVALAGAGLGVVIAVPAGLFLARRAMRPIDTAFRRQRTFIADASHELRTPLTLIRANVELTQRLPDTPASTSSELTNILDEVDRMSRLVNDLLLLTRVGENQAALPQFHVDLLAMVKKITASMQENARKIGISLDVNGTEQLIVRGHPDRLLEAIQAILDNAFTYTPAGGSVSVSVERYGHNAVVRITDTGIGIAPADQNRVFDRFYRADDARARAIGGTGLGLTIAKAIIEAHGGKIDLRSTPGKGTEVRLILPLVQPPNDPTPQTSPPERPGPSEKRG